MAKEFWIDHSDPPYPEIRHISHPGFDERFYTALSFAGARREIRETCREHRNHWLSVRHTQLSRGVEEIIAEAISAGKAG